MNFKPGDKVRINAPTGSYAVVSDVAGSQIYVTYHYGRDKKGDPITATGAVRSHEIVHVDEAHWNAFTSAPAWSDEQKALVRP